MKKIGLVGYGYWGPNLLRNFVSTPDCEVLYCCDIQLSRIKEIRKKFSSIIVTSNYQDLLEDKEVDGIVIATPTKFHFPLAKLALENGKDVLIEKPMALNTQESSELISIASKQGRIIMIDHTFLFNEPIRKLKTIIDSGEIGDILYIDSTRANLGLFQKDSNAIFDLATHDFSIIQYLLGTSPEWLQAFGQSHYGDQEDVCYVYAQYPKKVSVHLHVSWLSPLKVRKMIIVGTKKMITYDDIEVSEKIRIYEKGVDFEKITVKDSQEIRINYRSGDILTPNLKITEALGLLAREFVSAMNSRSVSISDGKFGAEVVKLLESSTESMRLGKKVIFKSKQ